MNNVTKQGTSSVFEVVTETPEKAYFENILGASQKEEDDWVAKALENHEAKLGKQATAEEQDDHKEVHDNPVLQKLSEMQAQMTKMEAKIQAQQAEMQAQQSKMEAKIETVETVVKSLSKQAEDLKVEKTVGIKANESRKPAVTCHMF